MYFGVNFILQKFCLCKKNDKYEVWTYVWHSYTLRPYLCSKQVTLGFYQIGQTKWEVPAPLYVFYGTIRFCGKNWNSVDKKEKMKTWPDMTCSHVLNIYGLLLVSQKPTQCIFQCFRLILDLRGASLRWGWNSSKKGGSSCSSEAYRHKNSSEKRLPLLNEVSEQISSDPR